MCFLVVLGFFVCLFVGFFTPEAGKASVRTEQVEEAGAAGSGEH